MVPRHRDRHTDRQRPLPTSSHQSTFLFLPHHFQHTHDNIHPRALTTAYSASRALSSRMRSSSLASKGCAISFKKRFTAVSPHSPTHRTTTHQCEHDEVGRRCISTRHFRVSRHVVHGEMATLLPIPPGPRPQTYPCPVRRRWRGRGGWCPCSPGSTWAAWCACRAGYTCREGCGVRLGVRTLSSPQLFATAMGTSPTSF